MRARGKNLHGAGVRNMTCMKMKQSLYFTTTLLGIGCRQTHSATRSRDWQTRSYETTTRKARKLT